MESTNIAAINAMNRPVVTAKDIAEKLGIGKSTVQGCLNNKFAKGYRKETVDKVRKAAEEMGYDKQACLAYGYMLSGEKRRKIKEPKNYRGGNFLTKEAEVQRMKELRAEGYTNFQIARKIGRSFGMVFHCIGKQDPSLTAISHKLRGQRTRTGDPLTTQVLFGLMAQYSDAITCVCFMGDGGEIAMLYNLIEFVHDCGYKVCVYSGMRDLPPLLGPNSFWPDYLKAGPYIESLGGLDHPATNQRFYFIDRLRGGELHDWTHLFWKEKS